MKLVLLLVASVIVVVVARPQENVELIKFDQNIEDNNYKFEFEQSDQTKRQENGEFTPGSDPENPENGEMKVSGEYSYVAPDGKTVRVTYTADADGYKPVVHTE